MRIPLFCFLLLGMFSINSQTTIDGSYDWQTEDDKKFNIYIPSSYDQTVPNKLIVGFHPFNTNRWDSESWRDTLISFAESVDAILLCTDGGPDGKVDDPIDTSFTSFMIDSIQNEFNIDQENIYGAGFSWGGRTTYTYGLNRPGLFNGHLVIGAAINGLNEVGPLLDNAILKSFYLVHGSNDSPDTRFFPVKSALEDNNACIETNYLQGVNHTIDFANRNAILKEAFEWLENRNCGFSSTADKQDSEVEIYPNPTSGRFHLSIGELISVHDRTGKLVPVELIGQTIDLTNLRSGFYFIRIKLNDGIRIEKVLKIN